MTVDASADAVIRALDLTPHPEGGFFRETYRHQPADGGRGALTVIHYLLRAGERSAWHRVDATEVWHFTTGEPLALEISEDGETTHTVTLGAAVAEGQHGHAVVPAGAWQSAESLGNWTLVSCTVAPAFQCDGFEMAPPGWAPRDRRQD